MRIAMLIPGPDYPEPWDWAYDVEADALRAAGASVDPIPWNDTGDLGEFDLILPLVAWGYHKDYDRWLALLTRAEAGRWPMINPPQLLRWNSDKKYLVELAAARVPTVPTMAVAACCDADIEEAWQRFGSARLVIKPTVSASAGGLHKLAPTDDLPADSRGQPIIVQPLIEAIATTGEYSLILFGGEYSHAVFKRPKPGDFRVQEALGGVTIPSEAPTGAIELAKRALAATPIDATYARVDIIPDDEGVLRIMELELIEPALFLDHAPGSSAAFAKAVLSAANRPVE
jgi:glutathione synthase/RimK-type ligase-like ATP-grasp enzyme